MNLFREQLEPYKKKIGIEKAESTYCGLDPFASFECMPEYKRRSFLPKRNCKG